jgi:hypothetical protein
MRIPSHHVSGLRALVDEQAKLGNQRAIRLQTIFSRPARKNSARVKRETKRKIHREETTAIREAVVYRANGFCEACWLQGYERPGTELDHFEGGSGRRRERQSVENTWLLCSQSHRARSLNAPSAAHWNRLWKEHTSKHGYPFHPHIEHAEVAAASPAQISLSLAREQGSMASSRVFGPSSRGSLASYDPATSSWRTSQLSLLEDSAAFSETWPRSGMTRSGTAYRLEPWAPLTAVTESGSWPTPLAMRETDRAKRPNGNVGWAVASRSRCGPPQRHGTTSSGDLSRSV